MAIHFTISIFAAEIFMIITGTTMLTIGNQLKAARALADIDQIALAKRAGVNAGSIRKMEAKGSSLLTSGLDTIRAVQNVLELKGIEFLNHGSLGVRLREPKEAPPQ